MRVRPQPRGRHNLDPTMYSGEGRAIACLFACDHHHQRQHTTTFDKAAMADLAGDAALGTTQHEERASSSKRPNCGERLEHQVLPFALGSGSPEPSSAGRHSTGTQVNIAAAVAATTLPAARPAARVTLASRDLFPGPRSVVEGVLARAEQQVRCD